MGWGRRPEGALGYMEGVRRPAYTLTEVLVAVALLAMVFLGATSALASAFGVHRRQDLNWEMRHVVHDQMEQLTARPYRELVQDVQGARRSGDPGRGMPDPRRDMEQVAPGEAVSVVRMHPPPEGAGAYRVEAKGRGGIVTNQRLAPGTLEAKLRLQYWDPLLDTPSAVDRGLVRATLELDSVDGQMHDQAVKYLTR